MAPVASAATGDISTFAGNGTDGHSGDSGLATSAAMRDPLGVAVALDGDRYIVDYGSHRVRKVTAAGVISTFAGTGSLGFSGNEGGDQRAAGPAGRRGDRRGRQRLHRRLRQLAGPRIARRDHQHLRRQLRLGVLRRRRLATSARLQAPFGLDVDSSGNLYIADFNHTVRRVTPAGTISTVAGTGTSGSSGDGGPATSARLNGPADVVTDSAGNLYITEYSDTGWKVNTSGTITRFAGTDRGYHGQRWPGHFRAGQRTMGRGGRHQRQRLHHRDRGPRRAQGQLAGDDLNGRGDGDSRLPGRRRPGDQRAPEWARRVRHRANGDAVIADYANHRARRIEASHPRRADADRYLSGVARQRQHRAGDRHRRVGVNRNPLLELELYDIGGHGHRRRPRLDRHRGLCGGRLRRAFWATATNAAGTSTCSSTSVTYVEDSIAPAGPVVFRRRPPGLGSLAVVVVHRRRRRDTRVPPGPRRHHDFELGDLHEPALVRPDRPAGRHLHALAACPRRRGNTSTVTTSSYVLDTTAPARPASA